MARSTDITLKDVHVYFLPVETRVPLKFGPETVTSVTCARVWMRVEDQAGHSAEGWGGNSVERAMGVARYVVV